MRLLQHLPDKPVYRLAHRVRQGRLVPDARSGGHWCVPTWAGCAGRWTRRGPATPEVRAAAHDGRRLDALVRNVFGYWFVTYVESAMAPRYDAAALRERVRLTDPDLTTTALGPVPAGAPGPIFVGLHFGSVEFGALYAARLGQLPLSGPMEQVRQPGDARLLRAHPRALGMELLPMRGVAPVLVERIRRGEAVALVADRVIGGQGTRVELFGAPARLPAGPAILALETGAPMYALAVHRSGPGAWVGRVERLDGARRGDPPGAAAGDARGAGPDVRALHRGGARPVVDAAVPHLGGRWRRHDRTRARHRRRSSR